MSTESLQFVEVGSEGDLEEGAMRAVQVEGKRVLLTMVEGKPYAIGAICTHERANLDEGTLMGHEVYCPLHFSCFDVRTGEALAPPADRSTSVYAVKLEDGKVLVSAAPVDP
jgi:glycine betaine catabolism B